MYAPIEIQADVTLSATSEALTAPAAVGDKQLVYLLASNTTGGNVSLTATGATFASGLTIADTEAWMLGPVLGADIPKWGAFRSGGAIAGLNITFIAGDVRVDTGTSTSPFGSTPAPALTLTRLF